MSIQNVFIVVLDICREENLEAVHQSIENLVGPEERIGFKERSVPGLPDDILKSYEYDEEVSPLSLGKYESVLTFVDSARRYGEDSHLLDITTIAKLSEGQIHFQAESPLDFFIEEGSLIRYQEEIETIHQNLDDTFYRRASDQTSSTITMVEIDGGGSKLVVEESDTESDDRYPDLTEVSSFIEEHEETLVGLGYTNRNLLSMLLGGELITNQLVTNDASRHTVITSPEFSEPDTRFPNDPPESGRFKIHTVRKSLRKNERFRLVRRLHRQRLWSRWYLSQLGSLYHDIDGALRDLVGLHHGDLEKSLDLNERVSRNRARWIELQADVAADISALEPILGPNDIPEMDLSPLQEETIITITGEYPVSLLKSFSIGTTEALDRADELSNRIDHILEATNDHITTQTNIHTTTELREIEASLESAQQDTITILDDTKSLSEQTGKLQRRTHGLTRYLLVIGVLQAIVAMVQILQLIGIFSPP